MKNSLDYILWSANSVIMCIPWYVGFVITWWRDGEDETDWLYFWLHICPSVCAFLVGCSWILFLVGGIFIVQVEKGVPNWRFSVTQDLSKQYLLIFFFMFCALSSRFCIEVWSVNGGMWSLGWKARMEKKTDSLMVNCCLGWRLIESRRWVFLQFVNDIC